MATTPPGDHPRSAGHVSEQWRAMQAVEARMQERVQKTAGHGRGDAMRQAVAGQAHDAGLAGETLEGMGYDHEARAMGQYQQTLKQAIEPGRETVHWGPVVEGLQASFEADPETLTALKADERIRLARASSMEAAMVSWSAQEDPETTISQCAGWQQVAARYKQEATVVEIDGEPVEYDQAGPIRAAVTESMTEAQRSEHMIELLSWKQRMGAGDVTALDDAAVRGWTEYGTPLAPDHQPGVEPAPQAAGSGPEVQQQMTQIQQQQQGPGTSGPEME